jgi:hypothetical protein
MMQYRDTWLFCLVILGIIFTKKWSMPALAETVAVTFCLSSNFTVITSSNISSLLSSSWRRLWLPTTQTISIWLVCSNNLLLYSYLQVV